MSQGVTTEEGIRSYLSDLDGFEELRRLRRKWTEGPGELKAFLILGGRYWLDSSGNTLRVLSMQHGCRSNVDLSWLHESLPDVLAMDDFKKVLPTVVLTGMGPWIPSSASKCRECGKGWTIHTIEDSVGRRSETGDVVFHHRRCKKIAADRSADEYVRSILSAAGLTSFFLVPIENGYFREPEAPCWHRVQTTKGDLVVGWRKRVFSIDWTDIVSKFMDVIRDWDFETRKKAEATISGTELFRAEDVTKDVGLVHAWSTAKAVEYLRAIVRALELR